MSISKEDVEYIANLAKLSLADEELEEYTSTLSSIVEYAKELSTVSVDGVEPTAHILPIQNVFRKDEVVASYHREKILQNAPTKEGGCISVPKVMED